jgi:hypothetical protein
VTLRQQSVTNEVGNRMLKVKDEDRTQANDLVPQDLYSGANKIGSKTFVYNAIARGDIPSYRIGKKLFIPRDFRALLFPEKAWDSHLSSGNEGDGP